jgi:hypothetical protein
LPARNTDHIFKATTSLFSQEGIKSDFIDLILLSQEEELAHEEAEKTRSAHGHLAHHGDNSI